MVDAPVARQRRLKAHAAQDLIRPVAVFSVGVGKGVRCAAGMLRELILQALQVRAEQLRIVRLRLARVRQAAVALRRVAVQVVGVVLHLDETGGEHLIELRPCDVRIVDALTRPLGEIVRVASEQRKDDARRILPQQRQHIDVVVVVPVVKAEHDGLFRQRRTVTHIGDDVRHDDGRVAVFRQPSEVRFQLPRLDGILAGLVGLDLVIHDDRQRHGVRLLPGGIGRERAEHEQRRQHDGHHPLRDRQRSAHGIHLLSFHAFGGSLRRARKNHARARRFAAARCTHLTPSTIGSTRNASPIATAYSAAEMGVKSKALAKNGT